MALGRGWHCRGTPVGITLEHWCHVAPASLATVLPGAGSSWGCGIVSLPSSPTDISLWGETGLRVPGRGGCRFGCPWLQLAAEGRDAPGVALNVGLSSCQQGGLGWGSVLGRVLRCHLPSGPSRGHPLICLDVFWMEN